MRSSAGNIFAASTVLLVISAIVINDCVAYSPFWGSFLVMFPVKNRDARHHHAAYPIHPVRDQGAGNANGGGGLKSRVVSRDTSIASYDLFDRRFPEDFANLSKRMDVDAIIFPGAETTTLGYNPENVTVSSLIGAPERRQCPPGQRFHNGRCR